ncbi:MAG: hypothetical protein JSU03_09750 [Bacteroidetes bacterium]|nr:hypothetical protein [Bacteroidota bacterium]MBS1757550.1 hypothetical protein [Bacteroidota bacterium]
MNLDTLNKIEFSDADLEKMDTALEMLEEIFAGKVIHIKTQTSNSNESKPLAVHTDDLEQIESAPAFINMPQWIKDEKVRDTLGPRATRLENIAEKIINTNRAILKRCWSSSTKY